MKIENRYWIQALLIVALLIPALAMAGTDGTEFEGLWTLVFGWAEGFLGKSIALVAFIIGAGIGAARSNPIPAVAGIVIALFFAVGPGIIDGVVGMTV